MRQFRFIPFLLAIVLLVVASARAGIDQAMPGSTTRPGATGSGILPGTGGTVVKARPAFKAAIKLDELRTLLIQHNDQIKIMDSWARQSLSQMRNAQSIDGDDPLYTALDIAFRPEAWVDENIIYIQAVPIRQQMAQLVSDPAEQNRILTHATVSPRFMAREDVKKLLDEIASNVPLSQAVNKVKMANATFLYLQYTLVMIPSKDADQPWISPMQLAPNVPEFAAQIRAAGSQAEPYPGWNEAESNRACYPFVELMGAWKDGDAATANAAIAKMAEVYPQIDAAQYRSPSARTLELIYNRSFNGTIVALVYFLAFALFTIGAMAQQPRTRKAGMIVFGVALACHILAMSIRWYLAGRIPIQNQFESVLGAALIGCVVGFVAESLKRNGLFGMAFSFVGFLAMTCCYVFPFVVGKSIGENIGKVAGILNNTYWLYIHVNTVIASYSLIAAAAVLGGVYLVAKTWHWITPTDDAVALTAGGPGTAGTSIQIDAGRRVMLEQLDAATTIVLQMAFWVLGTGIVFGAIWADVSWGRPWGWDPKETFALVTWIVYLVIIHVRFIFPQNRATVTAILAVIGLIVMLFNWIGVNFWLAGLHSYA